jgi:Zn-dependent peptidase ImmA (M78 family)
MSKANINKEILVWARERSGVTFPEFAEKCGVSEKRLLAWESGTETMTFNQAMRYAEKAYVPFGYLFLATPPVDELPIPDLRTVGGQGPKRPSSELLDLVKLMLQRQEWYREYLKQHFAEPNQVVGQFSIKDDVSTIVLDMREKLEVGDHPERGSWEDYYRLLTNRIEAVGVLVMRQGNLGHYSRPLHVEEFRGFAISDEYAPVIFVNHADAQGARLFTLIHELCHIWIGSSGVSDGNSYTHRKEESLCNSVAAEFLVPADEFRKLWHLEFEDWRENLTPLEVHFHVSTCVLARRALTLKFISQEDYARYISDQQDAYKKRKASGGPTYYQAKKAQISQLFSKAVVTEALSGQLLLREASQLLDGIKPNKIAYFAKELGI